TSPSSTLQNLVQGAIVSDTKGIPSEDVMQSIQTNKIALMSTDPALVTNTYVDKKTVGGGEYGFCTLRWITEPLFVTMVGWGMARNSPIKEIINNQIEWLHATGLMYHLYDKVYDSEAALKCRSISHKASGPKSFNLSQYAGVFMLWAVGCGIATVIFFLEKLYYVNTM
ncbi:unnamed protein product, partial [Meganyctiphanes norvegica]